MVLQSDLCLRRHFVARLWLKCNSVMDYVTEFRVPSVGVLKREREHQVVVVRNAPLPKSRSKCPLIKVRLKVRFKSPTQTAAPELHFQ